MSFAGLSGLTGCAEADGEAPGEVEEIVRNLELAGYASDAIDIDDLGRVIVGEDIHVTLAASREMVGVEGDELSFRNYRTSNLVDQDVGTICLIDNPSPNAANNGFRNNAVFSEALDQAMAEYNGQDLIFSFERRGNAQLDGCDAHIAMVTVESTAVGGVSGFPSGGVPYPIAHVTTGTGDAGTPLVKHVTMHEIGHTIGFRHTDYFDRSISCGGPTDPEGEGIWGVGHIFGTPTDAVYNGSVYNACVNPDSDGTFSEGDLDALRHLYGRWANRRDNDFDNGMFAFSLGGHDAARVEVQHCNTGHCIRLRDGSGGASSLRVAFGGANRSKLRVAFNFKAVGVENGERLFVELDTGDGWSKIATFTAGQNFENGQRRFVNFTRNRLMEPGTQLRIRSAASDNTDRIFVDDVKIDVR